MSEAETSLEAAPSKKRMTMSVREPLYDRFLDTGTAKNTVEMLLLRLVEEHEWLVRTGLIADFERSRANDPSKSTEEQVRPAPPKTRPNPNAPAMRKVTASRPAPAIPAATP